MKLSWTLFNDVYDRLHYAIGCVSLPNPGNCVAEDDSIDYMI